MLWSWLGNLIAGPILGKALDAYKAKLSAGNTADSIAADLAAKEIMLQAREAELQTQYRIAEIGHWREPDKLLGYCVVVYFAKLLIWDKVLGLGSTDGLCHVGDNCWAGATANLIVGAYFAKRGFENIARIIRR